MATVNFILPTDMSQGFVWYGYVQNATSTEVLIWDGYFGGDAIRYKGNGFTYSGNSVTGGTVTGIDYAIDVQSSSNYKIQFQISGLNLSAAYVASIVNSGDYFSLISYALSGNDIFNGSTGNDVLAAFYGNDVINGNAGDDILLGMEGDDSINGGTGADFMAGGLGNDTYVVDNLNDNVTEQLNEGTDLVQVAIATANGTFTLSDHLENGTLTNTVAFRLVGNTLNNILTGNAAANTLEGGDGEDTLNGLAGADTLIGGAGSDTYTVDVSTDVVTELTTDLGTDLVQAAATYTLNTNNAAGVENLILTGTAAINGTGNALNNTITGNTGANVLNGGTGDDTLIGGAGNDTYVIDSLADTITEGTNAGTDLVQVAIATAAGTYVMAANVENGTLTNTVAYNLTGNDLNNTLTGNAQNNTLDGGAGVGVDTLIGGTGNDTYIVDLLATGLLQDTVTETSTVLTEIDTIQLRGNFTLTGASAATTVAGAITLGANIENLDASNVTSSTGLLNLVGNALANTITGSSYNDVITGAGGTDVMNGGDGDDLFIVALTADHTATETINGGNGTADEIRFTSTTASTLTLSSNVTNVEKITVGTGTAASAVTTGTTALNINAAVVLNALSITGNNGNNILTGTNFGDTLIGNGGNDTLNGGLGADTMSGGAGNDTYAVDNVGEVIVETLNQGTDLVQVAIATANSSYTLLDHLENATLTNAVNFNLTGNGLNNTLTGNALNNTLDGGAGVDTLIGGAGDDTYIVDLNPNGTLQDTITEIALATNNDKVQLRGTSTNTTVATLTLAANLEHLDASATGSSLLNLTGNTANNQLTGNTANNILNGLAGVDTMAGGAGNDTYVVDNLNDIVTELLNEGTDLVQVAIATAGGTYVMTTNVENGTLTNTVAYNLTGNELNNTLTGNAAANTLTGLDGNDTLNGLAGADRMLGGLGDDTYTVDNVGDVVIELANQGTDTILSSVTYALNTANAIGVENLTLTGTTAINGTGNDLNNTITGNTGINILNGGAGNDTLNGGLGNDNLTGGLGSDTFVFNTALNATTNRDTITDFVSGTDRIELENSIMTGLGSSTGQLTIDQFRSGAGVTTAGDASDRIIYNNTTGGLFYDADGLGGTAAIQIALIGVNTVLTSQDIFIV